MKQLLVIIALLLSLSALVNAEVKLEVKTQQAELVLASLQVVGPNRFPIGFAYRERSDKEYSGWVFLSGSESQEYLDNSKNLVLSPLELFLELDPSLKFIVNTPVGTYWERTNSDSPWSQIEDYPDAP